MRLKELQKNVTILRPNSILGSCGVFLKKKIYYEIIENLMDSIMAKSIPIHIDKDKNYRRLNSKDFKLN